MGAITLVKIFILWCLWAVSRLGLFKVVRPEAETNLCTNPSFETNTTGWAATGTNSIAQSTDQSIFGNYSLLGTKGNSNTYASYTTTLPNTDSTYTITCYLYVPSDWDGGNVHIDANNFTGATVTQVDIYTDGTDSKQTWLRLRTTLAVTSDATGDIVVESLGSASLTRTLYIDAVHISEVSYLTTYMDGDNPGGTGSYWVGIPHGSKSTRYYHEASGGRIIDLDDDYSFPIEQAQGVGHITVENLDLPQSQQPGTLYQGSNITKRVLTLASTVIGGSGGLSAYHQTRRKLIRLFSPLTGRQDKKPQPRRLIYNNNRQIDVVYADGLNVPSKEVGFNEKIPVRLEAHDPYFRQVGENSQALDLQDSLVIKLVLRRLDSGTWDDMGPPDASGTYTQVNAIVHHEGTVYIGGDFLNFDNIANADYIVAFDTDAGTYSALGTGMNNVVRALVVDATGNIWVGGDFTSAGGTALGGLAYWDGSAWQDPSNYTGGGTVYALAVDGQNNVYIGGDFLNFDGVGNTDDICYWDGSAFQAMGTGVSGGTTVRAIAVDLNDNVYVGGDFTAMGGVSNTTRLAKWDGASWSALSTGAGGSVRTMDVANDGILYLGGQFSTLGGESISRIASWNGTAFRPLGAGLGNTADVLKLKNGALPLYVSGSFATADDLTVSGFPVIWNGSVFVNPDNSVTGNRALALEFVRDDLYMGGNYISAAFDVSGTTDITYSGTARSYPIITLEYASGTSDPTLIYIANQTTGAKLYFNYQMALGETITLDFSPKKRSFASSFRGTVWNGILDESAIAQFNLIPSPDDDTTQTNTIACFIDGNPAELNAFIRWQDTYTSYD